VIAPDGDRRVGRSENEAQRLPAKVADWQAITIKHPAGAHVSNFKTLIVERESHLPDVPVVRFFSRKASMLSLSTTLIPRIFPREQTDELFISPAASRM
jgi:hypothetical protein